MQRNVEMIKNASRARTAHGRYKSVTNYKKKIFHPDPNMQKIFEAGRIIKVTHSRRTRLSVDRSNISNALSEGSSESTAGLVPVASLYIGYLLRYLPTHGGL